MKIKIKQLFDEITKQKVYPLTTIKAVRDPSTKKSLAELLLVGEDVSETQDTPTKDADILGGKYRASDIDKSMTYDEDESTEVVENVEIVDADRLGGKYTANDIDVIKQNIDDANSNIIDIYVGDDGKLHKVQGGADSVLPFSGDGGLLYAFGKNNGCSFIKGGNSSGVITEESDNVNIYCSSNDNSAINIPIDVTDINEIILILGVNSQALVGLSSTVSYAPDIQRTSLGGTGSGRMTKHSIDTSSLTGNYYINISAWSGGKGIIYEILAR